MYTYLYIYKYIFRYLYIYIYIYIYMYICIYIYVYMYNTYIYTYNIYRGQEGGSIKRGIASEDRDDYCVDDNDGMIIEGEGLGLGLVFANPNPNRMINEGAGGLDRDVDASSDMEGGERVGNDVARTKRNSQDINELDIHDTDLKVHLYICIHIYTYINICV
jgi:hypothetical protein